MTWRRRIINCISLTSLMARFVYINPILIFDRSVQPHSRSRTLLTFFQCTQWYHNTLRRADIITTFSSRRWEIKCFISVAQNQAMLYILRISPEKMPRNLGTFTVFSPCLTNRLNIRDSVFACLPLMHIKYPNYSTKSKQRGRYLASIR